MSGVRCPTCGGMDYSEWGDMPCPCRMEDEQRQPEPTIDEYCAGLGHPYHSDEYDWTEAPPDQQEEARRLAGRCYCGSERYSAGGPADVVEEPA